MGRNGCVVDPKDFANEIGGGNGDLHLWKELCPGVDALEKAEGLVMHCLWPAKPAGVSNWTEAGNLAS